VNSFRGLCEASIQDGVLFAFSQTENIFRAEASPESGWTMAVFQPFVPRNAAESSRLKMGLATGDYELNTDKKPEATKKTIIRF